MKEIMTNYLVKREQVGANIALVRAVFDELALRKPNGVEFSAYRMGENLFVHISRFESKEAERLFLGLQSFVAFSLGVSERQLESPVVTEIVEIENYSSKN